MVFRHFDHDSGLGGEATPHPAALRVADGIPEAEFVQFA